MPLNEQKVQELIRQGIQANIASSRFQLNPIQRHIHNGADAPFAFQPIVTYVGVVHFDGTPFVMPTGWTIVHPGGFPGLYFIVHSLSTPNSGGQEENYYGAAITVTVASPNTDVPPLVNLIKPSADFFQILWTDLSGNPTDTEFQFILTHVNNKKTVPPTYVVSN